MSFEFTSSSFLDSLGGGSSDFPAASATNGNGAAEGTASPPPLQGAGQDANNLIHGSGDNSSGPVVEGGQDLPLFAPDIIMPGVDIPVDVPLDAPLVVPDSQSQTSQSSFGGDQSLPVSFPSLPEQNVQQPQFTPPQSTMGSPVQESMQATSEPLQHHQDSTSNLSTPVPSSVHSLEGSPFLQELGVSEQENASAPPSTSSYSGASSNVAPSPSPSPSVMDMNSSNVSPFLQLIEHNKVDSASPVQGAEDGKSIGSAPQGGNASSSPLFHGQVNSSPFMEALGQNVVQQPTSSFLDTVQGQPQHPPQQPHLHQPYQPYQPYQPQQPQPQQSYQPQQPLYSHQPQPPQTSQQPQHQQQNTQNYSTTNPVFQLGMDAQSQGVHDKSESQHKVPNATYYSTSSYPDLNQSSGSEFAQLIQQPPQKPVEHHFNPQEQYRHIPSQQNVSSNSSPYQPDTDANSAFLNAIQKETPRPGYPQQPNTILPPNIPTSLPKPNPLPYDSSSQYPSQQQPQYPQQQYHSANSTPQGNFQPSYNYNLNTSNQGDQAPTTSGYNQYQGYGQPLPQGTPNSTPPPFQQPVYNPHQYPQYPQQHPGQPSHQNLYSSTQTYPIYPPEQQIGKLHNPLFASVHSSHTRNPSSEFAFDVTTLPNRMYEDQLHNLSKNLPRPVVSFGFGGKLVVMFPKRAVRLNVMDNIPETELPFSQNGEMRVLNLSHVLKETDHMKALAQYPGVFSNTQKDTIISFINQIVLQFDRIESTTGRILTPEQLIEKQLWELLRLFVNIDRLTEDGIEDTLDHVKRILLQQKEQINQMNQWNNAPSDLVDTTHIQNQLNPMDQLGYIQQMQKYLVNGRIEQACEIACNGQLWGHALLLASMIDKATYAKVVTQFSSSSFIDGSPLKTLYLMFADRADLLFQPKQPNQTPSDNTSQLCKNWQENLAIVLANRTASVGEVIGKMGDTLWRDFKLVHCAHFCYLVGDFATHKVTVPSTIALIGANHRKREPGARQLLDVISIQRTEIYYFYLKSHFPNVVPTSFIAFRLLYAYSLAEAGYLSLASRYVTDIQQQVSQLRDMSYSFSGYFIHQLNSLEERLKGAGMLQKASKGGSIFSSLFSRVDTTINNIMTKEVDSPKTSQPTTVSTPSNTSNTSNTATKEEVTTPSKGSGWLGGWFSGKKKRGANLGTRNTRKWSEKLQRYIPIDADENTYVEQRDEPPPIDNSLTEAFTPPPSATPVFNSMTSKKYGYTGLSSYQNATPLFQSPGASPSPYNPVLNSSASMQQPYVPPTSTQGPSGVSNQPQSYQPYQPYQPNQSYQPQADSQPTQNPGMPSMEHNESGSYFSQASSQNTTPNQSPAYPMNQSYQPYQSSPAPFIPNQQHQPYQPYQSSPAPFQPNQPNQSTQEMPPEDSYSWSSAQWGDGELRISSGYVPEEGENK